VNDVDWARVVEEIKDVGLSQLNAVRSYLRLMLVYLLKLRGWPESPAAADWRQEIVSFQSDAEQRFAPSMRQWIDLTVLHARAVKQLEHAHIDGVSAGKWPASCPVGLDELLNAERDVLEERFGASSGSGQD
jgi:hypothetical protein